MDQLLFPFSLKIKDFWAKLKEFFAKLKVSENPATFVAAKWLKKKADLERVRVSYPIVISTIDSNSNWLTQVFFIETINTYQNNALLDNRGH